MIGIFVNLWNRISGSVSYLLDEFSGAAAAFSLRKLSTTYGGSAIRVRRASDNTEQDIGFLGQDLDEPSLMNFVGYQNLLQRSEEFADAYWFKQESTVTSNTILSPINTLTADSVFETTSSTVHGIQKSVSVTLGQSYNFSCYVRSINGREGIAIRFGTGTSDADNGTYIGSFVFNFTSETITNVVAVNNFQFQKIGDWYRISASVIPTAATLSIAIWGWNGSSTNYTGDTTKGLYLWGSQLSVGTTAQPYQVTTSAARSGDGFVTKWYTQDSNGENLLQRSEEFENAYWIKDGSTVSSNVTTAPNGTLTADSIVDNAASNRHIIYANDISGSFSAYNIFSIYAKQNTLRYLAISVGTASDINCYSAIFDLQNGTVSASKANGNATVSASISSAGNGWYRCSVGGTLSTLSGPFYPIVGTSDRPQYTGTLSNNNMPVYVGSGQSIFIWGAQLSQSSWLQTYNPTTTTAILRRDASQSTAANQPRIVNGGVVVKDNGKPSMFFDGVNDHFVGTDIALPVWSIFATAVNTIPSVVTNTIYSRGSSSNYSRDALLYLATSNKRVDAQRSDSTIYPTAFSYTSIQNYLVASGIFSGSQLNAFADSIIGTSVSTSIAGSATPVTLIGANRDVVSTSLYMGGEIGEIIVYNSDRTATRADIERNIGAYYQTHWTGASTGLLDQFGGAAAAYSLRNLSSSYRGPLIRVRRSSDNAETDIGGTYNGDLDVASLVSFTGGQNLILYSQDFNTNWSTLRGSVTANTTIAPDGTLTADSVICNTTSSNGLLTLYIVPSPATTITEFTGSCYIKAGNRGFASIVIYDDVSAGCRQYFNLITGQLGSDIFFGTGVTKVGASIQNVGNGWYRCSLTVRYKVSSNIQLIVLPANQADNVLACTVGDFGYVWGAQLNTGILQPYIPTTTAAVNGANAFVTKWYTQDNNYQNLLLYSEQFENAYWTKNLCTITPNATVAPNGSNTGELFTKTSGVNTLSRFSTTPYLTTGIHTYSIYVKQNVGDSLQLRMDVGGNTVNSTWTFSTKSFSNTAGVISASYQELPNGWFRLSVVGNVTSTGWSLDLVAFTNPTNDSFYVWGAQLNEGSVPQPYTATTNTISQRRDAIQATAASQPRIVNAGGVDSEGNRPALFFDGVDDNLSVPNGLSVLQNVVYSNGFSVAANNSSAAGYRTVYNVSVNGSTSSRAGLFVNGPLYEVGGRRLDADAYQSISGGTVDTVSKILSSIIQYATSDAYLYSNNNLIASSTSFQTDGNTSNTTSNEFRIGVTGAALYWSGDVQEMVLYNTNQFSSRPTIESNANSYYRIYWQGNGTALLDNYSGASAAYSLRNLSSAYTGPLIRVRRSSDNVERDIYGTFGGDLDIASLVAFVGANSGFVTTWYDQSGSGRHATQATAGAQPRIVNAGVVETEAGKPTIFFDGTDDRFTHAIPAPTTGTAHAVQAVVSSLTQTGYRGVFALGDALNTGLVIQSRLSASPNWGTYGTTDIASTQSLQSAGIRLIEMYGTYSVGTHNFYTNGASSGTYNSTSGQTAGHIGGHFPALQMFNGDISEIIYYNADRTASRIPIESNINNYYKIY